MVKVSATVVLLLLMVFSYAQQKHEGRRYTVAFDRTPVKDVLKEIEQQSGLLFSYQSSLLDKMPDVSLKLSGVSMEELLEKVFAPRGVSFKLLTGYIVLTKKKQYYTVSGTITDALSRETLIGATVYDVEQRLGTSSNNHGFYSFSLATEDVSLTVSFVGYNPVEINFRLIRDTTISIALEPTIRLGEVAVKGESLANWLKNIQTGQIQFPVKLVNTLPSLLSEGDVLKTLQLLPGVSSGNEGLAGLNVRGGNMDENLYLMDGIPVYNPCHLMGFFSTFNSNAVKHVDFYKGSFPARYGGRLSSVVDVRMKEGDQQAFHGNFSVGLIATKFDLEGPLRKGKSSFIFSARRTYMDLFVSPVIKALTEEKEGSTSSYNTGGYYFSDLNMKITRKFSERNQLSLSVYWGSDRAKYEDHLRDHAIYPSGEKEEDTYTSGFSREKRWEWNWGNLIAHLEYGSRISSRLYQRFSLSYNRYRSNMETTIGEHHSTIYTDETDVFSMSKNVSEYLSGIEDWIVKTDFEYNANHRHKIRFGGEYTYHYFTPEISRVSYRLKDWNEDISDVGHKLRNNLSGHEFSLFGEDEIELNDRLRLHPGFRFSFFGVDGKTYLSFEPRLAVHYTPFDKLSLKGSYTLMSQYMHLLAFGGISLPSDLWVPVTRKIEPMQSQQIAGGVYYTFRKGWNMTVEGYYKTMDNLIEYLDGSTILPNYRNWEENVAVGKGDAYGVEFQIQKESGKTNGWVNYALSWANRWFPGKEINYGRHYPAKNDNRHAVNVVVLHRFSDFCDISGAWVYASGARATLSLMRYDGAIVEGVDDGGYLQPEIGHIEHRNNYRLPDYHRLDLGVNFHRRRKHGVSTWNLSVYNVYSRLNPFFVYTDSKKINGKEEQLVKQASVFPVIPSFSYTFTF